MRPSLKPHQVRRDLRVTALRGGEIERDRGELVDDGHGSRVLAQVDGQQVAAAALARVDAHVRERLDVRQDRQPAGLGLPAERARHARERPARRTARAVELALRRDERLVRLAEHRELRGAAAEGAAALGRVLAAELGRELGERLEDRRRRRARDERVRAAPLLAAKPRLHDPLKVALVEPEQHRFPKRLGPFGHRRVHDRGKGGPHDVAGEVDGAGAIVERPLVGRRLPLEKRGVEVEQLAREVVPLAELLRPFAARLPDGGRLREQERHQNFSMFTRNALNSGVLAPTSPTMGVSAFASQYLDFSGFWSADTPTKPQWIGMPIWYTFLFPARVIGPSRFVTKAETSSFPRALETRTRSPFLMPFSFASSSGTSTKACGCRPTSSGTCCVT